MIGIVLLGHGKFGEGLYSALNLIGGKPDHFEVVNFNGESVDTLKKDILGAVKKLDNCEHILFLSDITGGSPFQTAAMIANENSNMAVIGGVNLGLLVEASITRDFATDFDEFTNGLVNTAKDAIAKFELVQSDVSDDGEIL